MEKEYDKNYFECGIETGVSLYQDYRWMPELTVPMVKRMIEYLNILPNEVVLDFGCAKGFTVKAFRQLGIEAYGVDVSSYAANHAPADVGEYIMKIDSEAAVIPIRQYDWFIAKDVLEHIEEKNLDIWLEELFDYCEKGFAIIPLGDGKKYNVPAYEKDVTHKIRQPLEWWWDRFRATGWIVAATFKVSGIKENWSAWLEGNGFFVLEKRKEENEKCV